MVTSPTPPPNNFVLERLRSDARHTMDLAKTMRVIGHPGVKGRFRELLINTLLRPWLPANVGCGTGILVDVDQRVSNAGQDDILLFDQLLSPAALASTDSSDGVFFFDNVLLRIEVKSTLNCADIAKFAKTSKATSELRMAGNDQRADLVPGAFNSLIAYDTNVAHGHELRYLRQSLEAEGVDPESGVVSMMAIASRGFWLLGQTPDGSRAWKELVVQDPADPLAYFVGVASNSCFSQRSRRLGISPLGGGVGTYLDHPFQWVRSDTLLQASIHQGSDPIDSTEPWRSQ